MRFGLLLILLFVTSCSGIFYNRIPYAEDVTPFVAKESEFAEAISTDIYTSTGNIVEDIHNIDNINRAPTYRSANLRRETSSRPFVKDISEDEFPKIKDVPEYPKNFPTEVEIRETKEYLISKKQFVNSSNTKYNSVFTGLDDPLLSYTTVEILNNKLPEDYNRLRPLLSCFIDNESLTAEDFESLSLIGDDRINNPYPILIKFYGNNNNSFRENLIENILLLGVDPSIIYVSSSKEESVDKAEVYLYY